MVPTELVTPGASSAPLAKLCDLEESEAVGASAANAQALHLTADFLGGERRLWLNAAYNALAFVTIAI